MLVLYLFVYLFLIFPFPILICLFYISLIYSSESSTRNVGTKQTERGRRPGKENDKNNRNTEREGERERERTKRTWTNLSTVAESPPCNGLLLGKLVDFVGNWLFLTQLKMRQKISVKETARDGSYGVILSVSPENQQETCFVFFCCP